QGAPEGSTKTKMEEGGWTNSNNFKQMIFYAGRASGTRYNSSVVWKKNFEGDLTAGLRYQIGEVAGSTSKGSTQTAALAYSRGPLNVSVFVNHDNINDFTHNSYSLRDNCTLLITRLNTAQFHNTTEVYSAADHLILGGGYKQASTHGFSNQTELGVGIRLRF